MMMNVACVLWDIKQNGEPTILVTHARSFRSEAQARSHYRDLIDSYRDSGYLFEKTDTKCEGIRGSRKMFVNGHERSSYVVIYIHPNPNVY